SKTLVIGVVDENGNSVTVTDATIQFSVAKQFGAAPVISKATGGSGITVPNPPGDAMHVEIVPSDTNALAAGLYLYRAVVTDVGGEVATVLQDVCTLKPVVAVA
ncbi:MAG: hypothetical protein MI861_13310, partial [Pirellulales bacterium]|nr:hypothetical protein [Pirellulales bacterium]